MGSYCRILRIDATASDESAVSEILAHRFGRIIEQKWTNDAGSTVRDRTQYSFDRNSNVTARTNSQQASLSEAYTFDGLDRLASTTRGGAAYQSWTLDGNGNWSSFTNQGSTQTRTHNAANEVATISGQTAPTHDAAGNLTQAPKPLATGNQVYVYDGWNRLTQVKETNGTVIATYEYDPRGNRVQKTTGLTVRDYYHNDSGQVVEVRVGGVLNQTIVWDLSFIDSPVMTKRDTGSDGTLDQSYYFTFDALRNVTSLINASNGNVLERYHYDAYGKVQMYNGSWGSISSSAYGNFIAFTGRERDAESGLYYFRARYWDSSLGRFLARDPIGYVDGMNLYQGYFVHGGVDPSGMRVMIAEDGTGTDWIPDGSRTIPWPDRDSAPMAGRRDVLDFSADMGTGYVDFLLFRANRWLQFEGDMTDEDGIAYKGGYTAGIAAGVVLTGGAAGAARGGAYVGTQVTRSYSAISRLQEMGESAYNVVTGHASVWDFLPFLPRGARRGARPGHSLGFADEAEDAARRAPKYGATPSGRPFTKHYGEVTGPQRNIPGSVVDNTIDTTLGTPVAGGKTVHYDPGNNVTVVTGDGECIVSVRKGPPRKGQY